VDCAGFSELAASNRLYRNGIALSYLAGVYGIVEVNVPLTHHRSFWGHLYGSDDPTSG